MRIRCIHALPLRILGWLMMISTGFVCQLFHDKNFIILNAWRGYCPDSTAASMTLRVKSVTECAVECNQASQCFAFGFYSSSRTCCIYGFVPQEVYYDADCSLMLDRNVLTDSSLMNSMPVKSYCNVDRIEQRDCFELTLVKTTNENTTICLTLQGLPVQSDVVIDLGEGPVLLPSVNNWIIVMQRFNGSLLFNRTWTEYKNGFGDIGRGEFWLGNEKVHRLTNGTGSVYSLRIEMRLNKTGEWFNADYDTFYLDSEDNYYAIHLSGFCGSAGDTLTSNAFGSYRYLGGMSFTSIDADNDRSTLNCAQQYQAGWWFNSCAYACLTCKYTSTSFVWWSLKSNVSDGILREARMMIRRK